MSRKLLSTWGLLSVVMLVAVGWVFLIYQSKETSPVLWGKGDVLRLHVLANSDSPADQQLKLKVRDAVIAYLAPYLEHTATKTAAKQIVLEHKDQLTAIAAQTIVTNGANYPVEIQVGMFDFPIKSYGSFVLPAGSYEAVRILVGRAEGKNWWCVLFPPLCFVDITNAAAMPSKSLANKPEEQNEHIEFRSKIAELWRQNIR